MNFLFDMTGRRVLFGHGSFSKIKDEILHLNCHCPTVVTTPSNRLRRGLEKNLAPLEYSVYDKAVIHVPYEQVRHAMSVIDLATTDCLLAVGGGSSIGMAKALALETGLPIIAVPTTFSGSEMTPIWGVTENGVKKTGKDERVLPKTVLYDPELYTSLPSEIAGVSAINALAHCVEALYAEDRNPVTDLMAEEGARLIGNSLGPSLANRDDLEQFDHLLCGAWMGGMVLSMTSMGLHHKLCHTLGGAFNLPHAATHAIVLPHVVFFNKDHAGTAMRKLAQAFGVTSADEVPGFIFSLLEQAGAKKALREIGMNPEDMEKAADLAIQKKYNNPRPFGKKDIISILENAYAGSIPA
jgi:maleylacetate reductase